MSPKDLLGSAPHGELLALYWPDRRDERAPGVAVMRVDRANAKLHMTWTTSKTNPPSYELRFEGFADDLLWRRIAPDELKHMKAAFEDDPDAFRASIDFMTRTVRAGVC